MQLRVFGCSFGWELWRCMVSISDSTLVALVEAPVSPVFLSSSSTTRGSSEIRQQKSRVLVRNALTNVARRLEATLARRDPCLSQPVLMQLG